MLINRQSENSSSRCTTDMDRTFAAPFLSFQFRSHPSFCRAARDHGQHTAGIEINSIWGMIFKQL